MQLHYLDFDFSEDELGHACWDALACVPPERWEALLAEAQALLAWCEQQGGPAGDMDAGFGWDFDLQATAEGVEQTSPIAITWAAPFLQATRPQNGCTRCCLGLSISTTPALTNAFKEGLHLE